MKTLGCSGCLIEAIERSDEATLRELLSAQDVEFNDTYWAPRSSLLRFVALADYPNCPRGFPVLSTLQTAECSMKHCTHSPVEQYFAGTAISHRVLCAAGGDAAHLKGVQCVADSRREPEVRHVEASHFQL